MTSLVALSSLREAYWKKRNRTLIILFHSCLYDINLHSSFYLSLSIYLSLSLTFSFCTFPIVLDCAKSIRITPRTWMSCVSIWPPMLLLSNPSRCKLSFLESFRFTLYIIACDSFIALSLVLTLLCELHDILCTTIRRGSFRMYLFWLLSA